MRALTYLQAGAGAVGVASKVPQILAIFSEGSTGQLSAFTVRIICFIAFLVPSPFLLLPTPKGRKEGKKKKHLN